MGRPKGSKNKPKDPLKQQRQVSLTEKSKAKQNSEPKGNPVGVCKKCGKKFQQELKEEINTYTDFDICPECRQREIYEKQKQRDESGKTVYNALLNYHPFPAQQEMHEAFESHRFLVLNCILPNQYISGCGKMIQDVIATDVCVGTNGKLGRVERVTKSPYKGTCFKIKTTACPDLMVTREHPVFVAACSKGNETFLQAENYKIKKEQYIKAESLNTIWNRDCAKKGLHLFMKIPIPTLEIEDEELNPDISFLLGCFVGCGELPEDDDTIFYDVSECSSLTKEFIISTSKRLGYSVKLSTDKSFVMVSSQELVESVLTHFNLYDIEEGIPKNILYNANREVLKEFLKGIYKSLEKDTSLSSSKLLFITNSGRLACDMQMAWLRLGRVCELKHKESGTTGIMKYKVYIRDEESAAMVGLECRFKRRNKFVKFFANDGFYTEIIDISHFAFKGSVYDLTTTEHSFCVNNLAVHNCGNRTGKDRFSNMAGIMYFVECLNENRHIDNPELVPSVYWWIIAPTETMAQQNWREIKKFFPKDWVVAISNSTQTMYTIGGGQIEVRSAYNPESLVGVGLDLVTITEAARIKDLDVVWANLEARLASPGRGRAKDRKGKKYGVGKAIINSSPIGKNYFYTMWTWGQPTHDEYASDWVSFSLPWTVNPANEQKANEIIHTKYGDITYAESLRRRIGDRAYRQNYLADFLAGSGEVFKDFKEKCGVDIFSSKMHLTDEERAKFVADWIIPKPYHRYRMSWDIATGSSEDSPVLMIRDLEDNHLVKLVDLYGKDYDGQYSEIAYWSRHYNNAECVFSSTGHTACVGQLEKRGVSEIVVTEQGGHKAEMIQNAECAVQNGDVHFLMDGSIESIQALAQIEDYAEKDGKYSNQSEPHDDWASALYLNYFDYQIHEAKTPFLGLFDFI